MTITNNCSVGFVGGEPESSESGMRRMVESAHTGDGTVERFGPVLAGSPASGFHDPLIEESSDVPRLRGAAFTEGALLSKSPLPSLCPCVPQCSRLRLPPERVDRFRTRWASGAGSVCFGLPVP